MYNLRNRSFLKEIDFAARELEHLLKLSAALKTVKYAGTEVPRLTGKEIALIFEKTSTRTRSAFEVAAYDQGAHVTYLDPSGSQLGHKESIADTARVLGRMYDAIEFRGSAQSDVEELAAHAGVPVYNGLTNEWHPTQTLADFLTMHESSHRPYDAITYTYMGDARSNMGRSLLMMGAIIGLQFAIAANRNSGLGVALLLGMTFILGWWLGPLPEPQQFIRLSRVSDGQIASHPRRQRVPQSSFRHQAEERSDGEFSNAIERGSTHHRGQPAHRPAC